MNSFRIPDATNIRYAHLLVSDLERSLEFYGRLLGLRETRRENSTLHLASDKKNSPIITLTEDPHASPRSRRSPGLFHIAILYPGRQELAVAFRRIEDYGWKFHGFADHGVSEALYLADPDGNGVELFADKPRKEWPIQKDGTIEMVSEPLDVENLMKEATPPSSGMPSRIGHIHLQVSDLGKGEDFYHGILGFNITQRSYPGALFVAAGNYHHHIGMNIWNSRGAEPSPDSTLGLIRFAIEVPDHQTIEQLSKRLEEFQYPYETFGEKSGLLLRDSDRIQVEILPQTLIEPISWRPR